MATELMNPLETRTVQLTIHNDLAEIEQLRDTVDRLAGELQVPPRPLIQLQVALDELVSNVIRYAWPAGGTHQLVVRLTLGPTAARIEVVDDGMSFDPRESHDPPQVAAGLPVPIGGRGISMLKNLVDSIDYVRVDGCNHITLNKRW